MLSYIVGGIAILLFLANPISQIFFPQSSVPRRLARPQLNESLLAINGPNDTLPECPPSTYTARVLKSQPLVIYLENFLSDDDRKHLLEIRLVIQVIHHTFHLTQIANIIIPVTQFSSLLPSAAMVRQPTVTPLFATHLSPSFLALTPSAASRPELLACKAGAATSGSSGFGRSGTVPEGTTTITSTGRAIRPAGAG